jgi:hypothetical protein
VNSKLLPTLMIFIGVLLIFSAYKHEDPRNIIFESLGIKRRVSNFAFIPGNNLGTGTFKPYTKDQGSAAKPTTPGQTVTTV